MTDPWFKFYPSDWRGDAGLRQCSYAARGLWMDLLSIMHEAEPYGHLLVNGKPLDARRIGAVLGGSEKQVAALLSELEEAGVFSRTDDGTIYSRRMLRDRAKADRDRANGKRGGNPDLTEKKPEKVNRGGGGGVNPPVNQTDNGEDKAQIPEARYQKEERPSDERAAAALTVSRASFPDARAELWGDGLGLLRGLTGKPEGPSRALLGRLLKSARDDCPAVMRALREAADLRPMDPIPWLTRAVAGPDDHTRLMIAAGLAPDAATLDGEATELFPRRLQ